MTQKTEIPKVGYVSEADAFLREADKKPNATSANRQAEEKKYKIIDSLRDDKNSHASNADNFI